MSEINCNNCAISDFKESLCKRCDEMKRLGRAEDIEVLLIKAFSEVDSPAKSDCISRQGAIDVADKFSDADGCNGSDVAMDIISGLISLPSVQPEFTDSEIQKIQELEQAQIKKAYELGFEEGEESVRRELWEYEQDRLD